MPRLACHLLDNGSTTRVIVRFTVRNPSLVVTVILDTNRPPFCQTIISPVQMGKSPRYGTIRANDI